MNFDETIAGVATPPGQGGLAVIRISGPEAKPIAGELFSKAPSESRRLYYGRFTDPADGVPIDDGCLLYMRAPKSYTGEDVVELHCHGGLYIIERLLKAVFALGARPALPGEFTRRAFMNGKMDLTQAEAVVDLIRAQTGSALASARGRFSGRLSARVNAVRDDLVGLLTLITAELDFSEEEIDFLSDESFLTEAAGIGRSITELLSSYEEGRALRDGVKTLILGRPNVGKSSLLNLLLREERAIVTPHAGTTRDVIEEVVNIRGLPVRLMDTAGLRDTEDEIESIGIGRAMERVSGAGLVLLVIDSSSPGGFGKDTELLDSLKEKKVVVVANKADLVTDKMRKRVGGAFKAHSPVFVSALTGLGLADLEEAVYSSAAGRAGAPESQASEALGEMIVSARQRAALEEAAAALKRATGSVTDGLTRDITACELRLSLDRIGEITGETTTEDILDKIFSDFCIGK